MYGVLYHVAEVLQLKLMVPPNMLSKFNLDV